jgi:hypothetical protein
VGGTGNCPIQNTFDSTLLTGTTPTGLPTGFATHSSPNP